MGILFVPMFCAGLVMITLIVTRIKNEEKVLEEGLMGYKEYKTRVIDPDILPKDRVSLLSRVEFTNLATNTRMQFEIVSPPPESCA